MFNKLSGMAILVSTTCWQKNAANFLRWRTNLRHYLSSTHLERCCGHRSYYEGESVNRSQMDIKRKICHIPTWRKHSFLDISFTNIDTLVLSLYQCVETLSIEVFRLLSQPPPHLRFDLYVTTETSATFLDQVVNRFMRPTFPTVHTKHFLMNIFCNESFFPQKKKTHNRTLLFDSTLPKHGRQLDYWTQPLNFNMSVCYLDCHEAGLCCNLVIDTQTLLHPLQLSYFHLWPIYWLSLA
jgi:hypothetical protein